MRLNLWPESLQRPKSPWIRNLLAIMVIGWMSFYPIYCSYYKANAIDHFRRHQEHVKGNSMFFNPWQYRVLCPLIIEGLYWTADHTIFAVIEIKGVDLGLPGDQGDKNLVTRELIKGLKNPEFIKYTLVFLSFRMIQNIVLILLCFYYFSLFIKNRLLVVFGVMVAVLFMGNSVVDSDLTFNTYMDITLYLLAGIVIITQRSPFWIIILTIAGALNRETALYIPVLYFFSRFSWKEWPSVPALIKNNSQVLGITTVCAIFFVGIFIAIRMYYGLQPVSTWRVSAGWPMLRLNMFSSVSIKSYMEFFGAIGLTLLWSIFIYPSMNKHLKLFFMVLVPIWFGIHLASAIAYQTRLFLVPTLLVLLPAVLENIEAYYGRLTSADSSTAPRA
jgi:hypothetical protein